MATFPHSFTVIFTPFLLLISSLILHIKAQSGFLPNAEVEALREIAEQMGNKDWNFSVNPCNHATWQASKTSHGTTITSPAIALPLMVFAMLLAYSSKGKASLVFFLLQSPSCLTLKYLTFMLTT